MPKSTSKIILFTVLIVCGVILNDATVSFLQPIQFIFTPVVLFLSARFLKFRWSLLLTGLVLAHFSWNWQSIDNAVLYFLQWMAYQFGLRRNWNLIATDLAFWGMIGIPLALLSSTVIHDVWLGSVSVTILLKLPVNGLICILIANLIVSLPFLNSLLKQKLSLQGFIKDVLLAVLFLPLLVMFFLTKVSLDQKSTQQVEQTNRSYALLTKNRIDAFLIGYENSVKTLAEMFSNQDWQKQPETQRLLSSAHKVNSGFLTMLIADPTGEIRFSSPPDLVSSGTNVKDRNYFQYPKTMMLSYISDVFRGRGFGVDPIVAISAPIADPNGQFNGIVEGSLDLYKFDFLLFMPKEFPSDILILDNTEKVIFASNGLNLNFLQKIQLRTEPDELYGNTLYMDEQTTEYTYSYETSANGWSIIFLNQRAYHFQQLAESYVRLLIFTLLVTFILIVVAQVLAQKLNRPIKKLLTRYSSMSQLKDDQEFEAVDSIFSEVQLLFQQFDAAYQTMVSTYHQQQKSLADKVTAEEKSKANSELLSKVSHELRTPLNAILGQVQLLMMDKQSEIESQKLKRIERAGKFLVFLIDDLLLLSKSELGGLSVACEPVELNKVIDAAIELLQESIQRKSINLILKLDDIQGVIVYGNELRLQQVFANLMSNAIKYNHECGNVEIQAGIEIDTAIISIMDNGFGIPSEHHANLFQPFNRLAQEHGEIEGSGIGLALAKQLLISMAASIEFEPVEGGGSRFTIRLPIAKNSLKSSVQTPAQLSLSLEQQNILCIEDNQTNYLIMSAWLKKKGCERLDHAKNGAEAIKLCNANTYSLILVDLGLPDINGLDLFGLLKNDQPKAVIVALTADNSERSRAAALEIGFDAFLTKPVIFDKVEAALAQLLIGQEKSF